MTIKEATMKWVNEFNAIPMGVVNKLMKADYDEIIEVTPPVIGDLVTLYETGEQGVIDDYDGSVYVIGLEDGSTVKAGQEDFEVSRDDYLPMWGTMWSFGDSIDEEWLDGEYLGNHIREMAECGFRIYEQEDWGHIFGIDGAGYDFYDSHWIPLYKARGIKWHSEK